MPIIFNQMYTSVYSNIHLYTSIYIFQISIYIWNCIYIFCELKMYKSVTVIENLVKNKKIEPTELSERQNDL